MGQQTAEQILKEILKTLQRIENKLSGGTSSNSGGSATRPVGPDVDFEGTVGSHLIVERPDYTVSAGRIDAARWILDEVSESGEVEIDFSQLEGDFNVPKEILLEDLWQLYDRGLIEMNED